MFPGIRQNSGVAFLDNQRLRHHISEAGRRQAEARQVARRVRELLPERLLQIEREYRRSLPPGKARRQALRDPRYLASIEELANVSAAATEARIAWETGRMLWNARLSINSYRNAVAWSGH